MLNLLTSNLIEGTNRGINKSAVKKQELLKYTYLQQHVYSP